MSCIEVRGLTKTYPAGVVAVDGVDLRVDDGEVVVLLGPTGCGKSTILRLIAGLEAPTAGTVTLDGESVHRIGARERGIALVFQDYALYPHLTVADNIGFPLMHADDATRVARVGEVARMLGLTSVLRRRPGQLSGGQRQRVAMARAIARPPQAFLLDQPLSSLDASAREAVRADVMDVINHLGVATVYVTHDQVEALSIGDRVAVMRRGRIEQVGTPAEVYGDPQRLFVAAFVGSPRMNLVQAAVYAEPEVRTVVDLGSQALELPWDDPRAQALARHHTARITVGVRPDALAAVPADRQSALRGVVRLVELRGHEVLVHVETGCSPTPHLQSHLELPDSPGELAHVAANPLPASPTVRDRILRRMPAQRRPEEPERYALQPAYDPSHDYARQALGDLTVCLPVTAAPRPGDTVALGVDVEHLYFFDGSGERIRLPEPATAG